MNSIRVAYNLVNLRAGPGVGYAIIGFLRYGATATVLTRNSTSSWWQISTPAAAGGVGWIAAWLVSFGGDVNSVPIFGVTATPTATSTPSNTPVPATPPSATSPATPTPADRQIYLTFDDGPLPPYTGQILDLLAQYKAKATFFCIGRNAERYPNWVDAAYNAGHSIANHTYSHPVLTNLNKQGVQNEIRRAEQSYRGLGVKVLRPPYGATNAYVRAYAAELGYRTILWDIDPRDWSRPGVQAIVGNVLRFARSGAVALFHDGGGERSQTVAAIRILLGELKARGYSFASITK